MGILEKEIKHYQIKMAKIKVAKQKMNKEFKIIAGIVLLLMAFVGISKIVTALLVLLGAYLIYQGLKKK